MPQVAAHACHAGEQAERRSNRDDAQRLRGGEELGAEEPVDGDERHVGEPDGHRAAQRALEAALDEEVTAEALQGLSQAEWWLSNEDEAVSLREQAHAAFRKGHDLVGAVRTALWLADEYRTVYGNESAANGWLTKAQRLAEKAPPGPISGWMAEARARGAADPAIKERYAADDWFDVWYPELAPSAALVSRARAAVTEAEWRDFVRAYRAEMDAPAARHTLDLLASLSHGAEFSLGCYCEDEARCHRSVLRALLAERGADLAPPAGD